MSNARNISKADSRFVNATGDTISGILNNESKVGIKVGSSPDTNLEVATRYSYNYAENMAIKVKNSESNYNNHMYLGSIGSSMIVDGARYYGGGAYLFEDAEASMIQMNNGATSFHARTGATVGGSSYSFPKVMGIDNAGRVTVSQQPSMAAHSQGVSAVVYNGTPYIPVVVTHNVGNHYNASTGTFTCPVAGKYLCNFHFLVNTPNTTSHAAFYWEKNGGRNGCVAHTEYHSNRSYEPISLSWIIDASQNDAITLRADTNDGAAIYQGQYSNMSIRLLG